MFKLGPRSGAPASLLAQAPSAHSALAKAIASGATPSYRSSVYGSQDVRAALAAAQFGKCAFCEVVIEPVSTPHVEHFRPKAAYYNEETGVLTKPGYYWLTYAWTNLLLACPKCNSSSKGSRFPLHSELNRAVDPGADLESERALLLDPFSEDPREFIRFRNSVAYAVDNNQRGETTIEVLDLNRESLVDARAEHMDLVIAVANAVAEMIDAPYRAALEARLEKWLSDLGPYRSCLEDTLSSS